jgi:sugar lactone lactonase YvrE
MTCVACAEEARLTWDVVQDSTHRVASISGLSGPEAVRYDPDQDVYFISNFNGEPAGDSNGFVTRARPDGAVDSLRFLVGTSAAPLHGPRGMFITGDTLWVADADGVHLFHRQTGAHLRFVDFRSFAPGFLNDIVQGPDDAIYITDTGRSRVYRIAGGTITIAIEDTALANPNGITWDPANTRFLLASWNPAPPIHSWDGRTGVTAIGTAARGRNDGIELVGDRVLIATQSDSSINMLVSGEIRPYIRTPGQAADIGIDTRRWRVLVPYVDLDRVDIWAVPQPE